MAVSRESAAPAPRRRGVVVVLLLALAVVTSALISQIWTRLKKIEYGYKISKASKENSRRLEINRRLRIEVALLKRPARIHRYATEELGMSAPRPEQIRRLRVRAAGARRETNERIRRSAELSANHQGAER
jgi:cell division protein FtsL